MNQRDKSYLFAFCLLVFPQLLFGQYRIRGYVVNEVDKQCLPFVTVALNYSDTIVKMGTLTNEQGLFIMNAVPKGRYVLSFSIVGYEKITLPVEVGGVLDVDTVRMRVKEEMLKEVVVTGKKVAVKQEPDKVIVDIQSYTETSGKTAFDVLKILPGVIAVGRDLTVLGKEVTVYVDGRSSLLTGQELDNFLKGVQGDQLDKVELITTPSARYDAGYSGAIIDIKLKRDRTLGLNGAISMTLGLKETGLVYMPGVNFNFRSKKTNVYGMYNYNYGHYRQTMNYKRKYHDLPKPVQYDEYGVYKPSGKDNFIRAGIDFFPADKHTLGLLFSGSIYNGGNTNTTKTHIHAIGSAHVDSVYKAPLIMDIDSKNGSVNLNYKWDIGTGSQLNMDVTYSYFDHDQSQETYIEPDDAQVEGSRRENAREQLVDQVTKIWTGRADYLCNVFKTGKLEVGIKFDDVNRDNNSRFSQYIDEEWQSDMNQSNHFIFDEQTYAAYFNLSKTIGKFSLMAGLRAERTDLKGRQTVGDSTFSDDSWGLFPSAYIQYKAKNDQFLSLSYSRKITRPSFSMLNPFRFYTSPNTYQVGKPNLEPHYQNTLELKYSQKRFTVSFNYRQTDDMFYQEPYQNDESKELYYTYNNFGSNKYCGLSLYVPVGICKWWNLTISGTGAYSVYKSMYMGTHFSNDYFDGYIALYNSFRINKTLTAQLYGYIMAKTWTMAREVRTRGYLEASISQQVFKGKGSITATVVDPFRFGKLKSTLNYGNIDEKVSCVDDMRTLRLSFSYNFGSNQIKGSRNRNTGAEELENRAR